MTLGAVVGALTCYSGDTDWGEQEGAIVAGIIVGVLIGATADMLLPFDFRSIRFSLRTLLIVVTVVAMGLGVVVWMMNG
jgi:hypothetical protein